MLITSTSVLAENRLQNLATRGFIGTGDNVLIGGLVISGTEPKTVVIRARGPSLTDAGVSGALADPEMALFSGATVIDSNDDWQTHAGVNLIPEDLKPTAYPAEAVIATTLQPGAYTAIVGGKNGATGIGLVEIFEVGDTGVTRLQNIATRGFVQTGDGVMIGGLVIAGTTAKKVVIRAKGPSLADQGVPNTLADPQMAIFSGATVIKSNDDWDSADNADKEKIPADLRPTNSLEATVYMELMPGPYTAIVSGFGDSTGVGIVEVFEVLETSTPGDSDGDGVPDSEDAFPNDASESRDTDGDGVGDNADAQPNNSNVHTLPTGSTSSAVVALLPAASTLSLGTLTGTAQDNRSLTYSVTTNATKGTVTILDAAAGTFNYQPNQGVVDATTDTFAYKVNDGFADSVPVTVTLDLRTDPLYKHQWHLDNTGQAAFASAGGGIGEDINVDVVIAAGVTGTGVKVAVLDSGLQISHEDLAPNVIQGGSFNFSDQSNDPTPNPPPMSEGQPTGDHGTSVAGLIAAKGWNSLGGRGVAPDASLLGFNVLATGNDPDFVAALGGAQYAMGVDIFNQSYGSDPTDDSKVIDVIEAQYVAGVNTLRGGKGAIYVRSAGNAFSDVEGGDCSGANEIGISCQNSIMDPEMVLPQNITVGALAADGKKASYSTAGSAIWISAPGGEDGSNSSYVEATNLTPAMITTDLMGCSSGYVNATTSAVNPFEDQGKSADNPNCNYTSTFNGTSSAAPVASGAIALILEARPDLTWRDVKHILATTSTQVDASIAPLTIALGDGDYIAEPAWTTNAAGFKFHNWYGFGRIDVGAAVLAAANYTLGSLGTQVVTEYDAASVSALGLSIPDNSVVGASNTIAVNNNLVVESVRVGLILTHPRTSDLGIELTSPSGTRSVLFTIRSVFTGADLEMELMSNAFYGEPANGNWTIKVVDSLTGETGTLTDWGMRFYGR
ncbi:MAG: S8 family serine peptidase [Pseudomonadota bacterium]